MKASALSPVVGHSVLRPTPAMEAGITRHVWDCKSYWSIEMTTPTIRIAIVCFAVAMLILNKPLGHMTAVWQRMIGLGVAATETTNSRFLCHRRADLFDIGDLGKLRFISTLLPQYPIAGGPRRFKLPLSLPR